MTTRDKYEQTRLQLQELQLQLDKENFFNEPLYIGFTSEGCFPNLVITSVNYNNNKQVELSTSEKEMLWDNYAKLKGEC